MSHSFTYSVLGVGILVVVFLFSYSYYRKLVSKQALSSLKGEPYSSILSLSSFLSISLILFGGLSILIIYMDYTLSAKAFTQNCAFESTSNDPYATCVNQLGSKIFVNESKAIAQYNLDHPNGGNLTIRNFGLREYQGDEFLTTLRNSFLFNNNIVDTKYRTFMIHDVLELEIIKEDAKMIRVKYMNHGDEDTIINPYNPISIWVTGKMVEIQGIEDVILKSGEERVVEYPFNGEYGNYTIRIHIDEFTYERSLLR